MKSEKVTKKSTEVHDPMPVIKTDKIVWFQANQKLDDNMAKGWTTYDFFIRIMQLNEQKKWTWYTIQWKWIRENYFKMYVKFEISTKNERIMVVKNFLLGVDEHIFGNNVFLIEIWFVRLKIVWSVNPFSQRGCDANLSSVALKWVLWQGN